MMRHQSFHLYLVYQVYPAYLEDPELQCRQCPESLGFLEDLALLEDPVLQYYLESLVHPEFPEFPEFLGRPEAPEAPVHLGHSRLPKRDFLQYQTKERSYLLLGHRDLAQFQTVLYTCIFLEILE